MFIPFVLALGSSIHIYYFGLIADQNITRIESLFTLETFLSLTNMFVYSLILQLHNIIIVKINENNVGDIRNIEVPV